MRVKATVSYDGSGYYGWQSQANVVGIQDIIEDALSKMHKEKKHIAASGRTDRGVHALGQVFHFDTELSLTEEQWVKALNSNLPMDIRILKTEFVDAEFHSRFSAKKKRYDYYLNMGEYNLFERNTVTQYNRQLDVDKMREAASILVGTHDFTSFCSNSFEETPNQVRTIETLNISREMDRLQFTFIGDGFLRYMVRMIVGVLIQVGENKLEIADVKAILEAKSKEVIRYKAEANGLYLTEVNYY